jgi:hypothetical protein
MPWIYSYIITQNEISYLCITCFFEIGFDLIFQEKITISFISRSNSEITFNKVPMDTKTKKRESSVANSLD